jgi:hypothetical protein
VTHFFRTAGELEAKAARLATGGNRFKTSIGSEPC